MTLQDARSALDDIRRLQDRTRDELVRHAFPLPYMLLMALGLFIGYASTDLRSPWDDIVLVLGFGLFVGVVAVHAKVQMCRAAVRRRSAGLPAPLEVAFYLGWAFSPLLVFFATESVAGTLAPAAPGTFAAAVTAVSFVAATPLVRRIALALMRQETR